MLVGGPSQLLVPACDFDLFAGGEKQHASKVYRVISTKGMSAGTLGRLRQQSFGRGVDVQAPPKALQILKSLAQLDWARAAPCAYGPGRQLQWCRLFRPGPGCLGTRTRRQTGLQLLRKPLARTGRSRKHQRWFRAGSCRPNCPRLSALGLQRLWRVDHLLLGLRILDQGAVCLIEVDHDQLNPVPLQSLGLPAGDRSRCLLIDEGQDQARVGVKLANGKELQRVGGDLVALASLQGPDMGEDLNHHRAIRGHAVGLHM